MFFGLVDEDFEDLSRINFKPNLSLKRNKDQTIGRLLSPTKGVSPL